MARSRLLPPVLLGIILVLDQIQRDGAYGIFVTGMLDEPAHLATAALILLATFGVRRLLAHPTFSVSALVASVAIDVDHIPLYAGVPNVADTGRPYTHSLLTVIIVITAWLLTRRRTHLLVGVGVGVLLHFVRDSATGPGLQLFWPWSTAFVALPYWAYLTVLFGTTVIATARAIRDDTVEAPSTAQPADC